MSNYNRREVLRILGRSALTGSVLLRTDSARGPHRGFLRAAEPEPKIPFPRLGKVAPRASKIITASPLSIGFETLDRNMFEPERTYAHLAQLGVKWARVQTGWGRCETEKGHYDFAWLDSVVNRLLEIGIQPWFNLGYGNRLYTPEAPDVSAVGWVPLFSEGAQTGWSRFVQALAKHFSQRVCHWEIWNEPNITTFWRPQKPNARDYVELVKRMAPLIRREVPTAVLIGGALAGMPGQYLRECLEAGLAEHVDRISYHPYGPMPEKNYAKQMVQFRELLAQYRPGLALWQGECGCPSRRSNVSTWSLEKMDWTEERQAKWLVRRILSDLEQEVELTSYFHTVDLLRYNWGQGPTNFDQSMGLLRGTDYTPKPSYFAYQCLCALFDAETRRDRTVQGVAEGSEDEQVHIVGFERKGRILLAYWTARDLFQPGSAQTIRLTVTAGPKQKLLSPVLVDSLRQDVYQLPLLGQEAANRTFSDLPLWDYPLILTDREALSAIQPS